MKTWFVSLNGAITLSTLALVVGLGHALLDWWYVFPLFLPDASPATVALIMLFYMAVFGGWVWALLAAARGGRGGLIATLVFALVVPFGYQGLGVVLFFCPTPCPTAWPLMEIMNWANLIVGLLAAAAVVLHLRTGPVAAQE